MATTALVPTSRYDQAEVVATIKQTVAKGATDAQLRMFLEVCKRTGLDPFLKEIWYVPEKGIVMAGRDGYLRVANEDPNFDGMETRVFRDDRKVPVKATCTVWRKDRQHPIVCEAYFSEYVKQSPVWKQYPSAMISKVAEVLALKRSFAINGVVAEEEIGTGEPRGSATAAQDVAKTKIVQMQAAQPAVGVIEALPEYEYEEVVEDEDRLAEELRQSIIQAEASRPQKRPVYSIMIAAFDEIHRRYEAIDCQHVYFEFLREYGFFDASEFPDTDEGLTQARRCYKRMSLNVSDLEVRASR